MGNGEEYNLDWEREGLKDSLFLFEQEWEIEKEYKKWAMRKEATILVGNPRKKHKFAYGKIRKVPRIIQYRPR